MFHNFVLTAPWKAVFSAAIGAALSFAQELAAPATVCTVFVLLDTFTAVSLSRRLRRKGMPAAGKVSSQRLGHTIATLCRIYLALLIAQMVQLWIVQGYGGFNAVRFVAAAVCVWQLLSILENESTCSDAAWAKIARRFLIDKAKRHLDL